MPQQIHQMLRQGDVLLVPTTAQPTAQAKRITDNGRVILAYGEVTSHAHHVIEAVPDVLVIDPDPVPAMELFEESDGTRLLVIKRYALLCHEEHDRIDLAPGGYEVRRQVEYTPAEIREVAD